MFNMRDLTARNMVKKHAIENAKHMTELIQSVSKIVDRVKANALAINSLIGTVEQMGELILKSSELGFIDSKAIARLELRVSELETRINLAEDAGRI